MSPQALALVTSVSYAGALICSRLGLKYSTIFDPYDSHSGFNSRPEFGALDSGFLSIRYPSCVLGLRHPLWHRRSLSAWGSSAGLYWGLKNRRVAQQRAPIDQSPDQRHHCDCIPQGISDGTDSGGDSARRGRSCSRLLEGGAGALKFSLVAPVAPCGRSDSLRRESSDTALRAKPVQRAAVLLGFHGTRNPDRLRRLYDDFIAGTAARLGSQSVVAVCVHGHF